ncbi:MAG: hypothetical protein IJD90_00540 [Clostridia bacterium]|nr:hypothetical protein [Clostridia bacterium]
MRYLKLFLVAILILTLCSCQPKPSYDDLKEQNEELKLEIEQLQEELSEKNFGFETIRDQLWKLDDLSYALYTDGYNYNYQEALDKLEEIQQTAEELQEKIETINDITYEYEKD